MVVRISQEGRNEGNDDREPPGGYSTHTGVEVDQGRPAGSDAVWDPKVQKSQANWYEDEVMEKETKSIARREDNKCKGPKVRCVRAIANNFRRR